MGQVKASDRNISQNGRPSHAIRASLVKKHLHDHGAGGLGDVDGMAVNAHNKFYEVNYAGFRAVF